MKALAAVGFGVWEIASGIVNVVGFLANGLTSLATWLPSKILKAIGLDDMAQFVDNIRIPQMARPDWSSLSVWDANPQYVESYKTARENFKFGDKADAIDAGLKSAQSGAEWLHDKATSGLGVAGNAIDGVLKKLGTRDERHLEFQRQIVKNTERAANATEKTAQNTDKSGMIGYGETAGRIGSYIAEDTYLNLSRVN